MSSLSMREYFPFSRVKITRQGVLVEEKLAMVYMEPDNRFTPICHICGSWRLMRSPFVKAINT